MQNRVLLVEDDDELRELLARYLTNQGFTVREAANGRDGLALALGQDCDIVVLDIMLPDISGLEVLRELRAETHLPPGAAFVRRKHPMTPGARVAPVLAA